MFLFVRVVTYASLFIVVHEEPSLRARFGTEYEAYRASVRRWWPRLRGAGRQ